MQHIDDGGQESGECGRGHGVTAQMPGTDNTEQSATEVGDEQSGLRRGSGSDNLPADSPQRRGFAALGITHDKQMRLTTEINRHRV